MTEWKGVGNTADNSSIFSNRNVLVAGSKTLLQQNAPVLNCGCQLMQVDLYDGCKMVVCVLSFLKL